MSLLMLFGLAIVILVVASQWRTVAAGEPHQWLLFSVQFAAALALNLAGTLGILRIFWNEGASRERREALVNRAREINLLNEVKPVAEDWPAVPVELAWTLIPGTRLRFRLKQKQQLHWNLIVSFGLALLFVIVASGATFITWTSWGEGRIDLLGAFLNAALLVGCAFSFRIFIRQLLSVTGIRGTRLEIEEYPLRPGKTYKALLIQGGRVRLKKIDVILNCVELATFRDGTDLRSESKKVFGKRVFRKRGIEVQQGQPLEAEFEIGIAEDAMHSFSSANNQVIWNLSVLITSRGWPDQLRTFSLLVGPAEKKANENNE